MSDVKISRDLFDCLVRVHLTNDGTTKDVQTIRHGLKEKYNQIERRKWYGIMQDKTLPEDVRQHAKEQYQDLSGVHPDWRY